MDTLLLSILTSTVVFLIFKAFKHYRIDTFQAVVVNYLTASLCGFTLFGDDWSWQFLDRPEWLYWGLGCSLLFLSLFSLIGLSSQRNGVAVTSVAVKMSLALSMVLIALIHSESFSTIKSLGVIFALTGVFLVTVQRNPQRVEVAWLPIALFFGSAVLDILLNFVQKGVLGVVTPALFAAACFGFAGFLGLTVCGVQSVRGVTRLSVQSAVAGIVLGIPNFFSIYLLIKSYRDVSWPDSSVLGVTNVGIVVLTALMGRVLYQEVLTRSRQVGLLCAVVAIALLSLD